MWDDEQELREVLRSEVEGPAPAPSTELAEVLRRGRRRVLARRAGAMAGVLAVVCGVGFGTMALRDLAGPPVQVGKLDGPAVTTTAPTATAPTANWTPASLPPRTPYGTWQPAASAPPPPDRSVLSIPQCDMGGDPLGNLGTVVPPKSLLDAWQAAVTEVAAPARVGPLNEQVLKANKAKRPDSVDAYQHWLDVTDPLGTGGVWLSVGTHRGDPLKAADEQAFSQGNCAPPRRAVLPDSTVVQFYPVRPSEPFQSLSQVLRVYRPDGRLVQVEVHNYGSPDFRFRPDLEAFDRFGPGRATLPLSEDQLTRIGLALATTP
ncbi:hypothetical protein [Saccharothrix coeruleofusca]|uniref:Uncharacterized protein n=1 Tax=Saccharothrix coeruleofusca TaxID=33919 RepID=A0A918EBQ9_9PSEU|nr:hypothetical protein [Saccharothrix coeruleofusca]MBP2340058.1 hypothetical protein [Saccharothrix coeruleofusca]GGP37629.1 hypothetical protein GCM10010185_06240 [Saccharothrix coeruleofusca]